MRGILALVVIALLVVLGGCGGDSSSGDSLAAADYQEALDAACERATTGFAGLSEDADLSPAEAQDKADEIESAFEEDVTALTPPEELADSHEALVSSFDDPVPDGTDPEESRAYAEESAELYADLGAEGCEAGWRDALEALPAG